MRDLTARLVRVTRRRLGRDDGGAIAVLVAMFLGTGVLLGMAALVVDVGQLYNERAQLQNGADAAALAEAKSCALGSCDSSVAQTYADQNSGSGLAAVTQVCGTGFVLQCAQSLGGLVNCPDPLPADLNFVDVFTSSKQADGSTLVPPVFAGALLGSSYHGMTVTACAQASWGAPSAATGAAITMPLCAWDDSTSSGLAIAPPPVDGAPAASNDITLGLSPSGSGCSYGPSFGWIAGAAQNCSVPVSGPTFTGDGNDSADEATCGPSLQTAQTDHQVILIPVYSQAERIYDEPPAYTLDGFAAFVVTGYSMAGVVATDWLDPGHTCAATQTCINGYFVRALVPSTGPLGGVNLGASVVELTG